MSKVAVMMSENNVKAQMSPHFGKAEWVMVADTECHAFDFLKNEAAGGKSVVEIIAGQNCSDAIFSEIGNGALGHLKAEGIRGWVAPSNISGQQALEMFEHLRLQAADSSSAHACCGSHHTGSKATTCCGR